MLNQIIKEELRSNSRCPKKFQLVDLGGALFGAFFFIDGLLRIKKGEKNIAIIVEIIIGNTMGLLHTNKFFTAKGE